MAECFSGNVMAVATSMICCGWLFGAEYDAAPIVVTASPVVAEELTTRYGGSVSVIGREQIGDMGAQDLPSALRRVSGVTISRFNLLGALGGADGGAIYVRGRGTGRPGSDITIFSDGVPRNVGVWDHPLMDVLALDHVQQISVYKGPQPTVNNGTFGSVELASRRRDRPGMETEAEIMVGEHGTLTESLHHGGRIDGFDYYGGFAHKETDGHRPHSDAKIQSLYGRVGETFDDGISLSAQIMATDNWVKDPGRFGGPVPLRDRFATRTVTSSLRLDNTGTVVNGFVLLYHEDGEIRWDKDHIGDSGTPPGAVNTDWENYGFRSGQTISFEPFSLLVGLDASSEGGSTENRTVSGNVPFAFKDRFETVVPGAALDFLHQFDSGWSVQPSVGLRHYIHSEFGDETTPHAGLVVRNPHWTWFANAARGVNYPGIYTVGIAAATMEQMDAEKLDHVEAGGQWRTQSEGVMLGISIFRDKTDNLLQWTPAGLVNAGTSDIDGAEFTAHFRPYEHLSLYTSLTLLEPEAPKTPRVPEWTASAGATLRVTPRLQIHADVDAVASQYTFNGRDGIAGRAIVEKIDSYVVGNLQVAYTPVLSDFGRLTVFAGCENINNETYETMAGYPLPGRFYNGGVRVAF